MWAVGDQVERLLDDMTDIWMGAVIVAAHEQGRSGSVEYDIRYADDGALEKNVESSELRRRTAPLDLPAEVWELTGACLLDKMDLCNFEAISRAPSVATTRHGSLWWCTAFHARFGRCGARCPHVRVEGAIGVHLNANVNLCQGTGKLRSPKRFG
eukprot:TRINITY_DN6703_c0_g1_i2.p1 TRINITY_DN6703_c0_g1~~TRINITY_DN6703_c0_g1_i2.p1  ORF type:complete len:155 (-),score=16.24 TRINITY_DN6703_c0_g1_i2:573-1037(-)